jgi:hypothetical protein
MSCECAQCRQHYRTFGFMFGVPTETEIQDAYHEAVKQWHPDLYENYASLRADAEEHFKQIQVAFRELKEHNSASAELTEEDYTAAPSDAPFRAVSARPSVPAISFGDAPGCLVASQFTSEVQETVARHLGKADTPVAIVDLSGGRSAANPTQFLLLASRGIMVRDARNMVSLLWYKDMGEVKLVEKSAGAKPSLSQRLMKTITGSQHNCSLHIFRDNGTPFFSMTSQADDGVKRVLFEFILRQKTQAAS